MKEEKKEHEGHKMEGRKEKHMGMGKKEKGFGARLGKKEKHGSMEGPHGKM